MQNSRKLKNWLESLAKFVEETESPRHFWLWSGLFILNSTLQRRVWLPYGLDNLYPNLYILIVAPPGKCRKGSPASLAKRFLQEIEIPTAVDSSSKRALTKELVAVSKTQSFELDGKNMVQAPLAIVSKEMSSLLAIDPKAMIEVLTDLYDSADQWDYKTSGEGQDFVRGVCVNCFIATTPTWFSINLPPEAIGGGFTTRFVILYGYEKYKWIAIPPEPDIKLRKLLLHDLNAIAMLKGPFSWGKGTEVYFGDWYSTIKNKIKETKDERLHGSLERMHINSLKTAMALRVAYSNELVLTIDDLARAIHLVEEALETTSDAFGGHGEATNAIKIERVLTQLKVNGKLSLEQLLKLNFRNIELSVMDEILETLIKMGTIKERVTEKGQRIFTWINK